MNKNIVSVKSWAPFFGDNKETIRLVAEAFRLFLMVRDRGDLPFYSAILSPTAFRPTGDVRTEFMAINSAPKLVSCAMSISIIQQMLNELKEAMSIFEDMEMLHFVPEGLSCMMSIFSRGVARELYAALVSSNIEPDKEQTLGEQLGFKIGHHETETETQKLPMVEQFKVFLTSSDESMRDIETAIDLIHQARARGDLAFCFYFSMANGFEDDGLKHSLSSASIGPNVLLSLCQAMFLNVLLQTEMPHFDSYPLLSAPFGQTFSLVNPVVYKSLNEIKEKMEKDRFEPNIINFYPSIGPHTIMQKGVFHV